MHRIRLTVTLLAVICMLARAIAPAPAAANAGPISDLKLLGAVLCHTGDIPDDGPPARTPACDHCPVCGAAGVVPLLSAAAGLTPVPALTEALAPRWRHAIASARASPRRANEPRAPPAA